MLRDNSCRQPAPSASCALLNLAQVAMSAMRPAALNVPSALIKAQMEFANCALIPWLVALNASPPASAKHAALASKD